MYRNTYLQLYKNTASHQQNPTILLSHFSQIYNTLGCVLQDLQYQIGRLQLQNSKLECLNERPQENQYRNYQKQQRGRERERNVIKIEESCVEEDLKKCKNVDSEARDGKSNLRKRVQIEEPVKYEEGQHKAHPSKSPQVNERTTKQKETDKHSPILIAEKVREKPKLAIGSDTFDDLFGKSNPKSISKSNQQKSPVIQPNLDYPQNSQIQNTYDDFLDRIFKETQSRKSR